MTNTPTPEQVAEALKDVTPGPWEVFLDDSGGKWTGWPLSIDATSITDKTVVRTGGQWPYEWDAKTSQTEAVANARFIAWARNNVEALAADRDAQKARADAAELELHGPISDLTGADITNIIAHLSLELEPRGPLPTRNSVMMALIAAQNDLAAEKAKVARLVEVLKWTDIELVKLFGLWFDDRPRSQIRAAIAEVQE